MNTTVGLEVNMNFLLLLVQTFLIILLIHEIFLFKDLRKLLIKNMVNLEVEVSKNNK